MADPISAEEYTRAVERMLENSDDRALIVSRRDFEKIEGWRRDGIPLAFVEEQWQELQRVVRLDRGRTPRLKQLAGAIDEAWTVVRDGRRSSGLVSGWEAGDSSCEEPHDWGPKPGEAITPELDRLVREILAAHESGADAESLDRRVDRELALVVPQALLDEIRAEVELELKAYRDRMPAAKILSTAERAIAKRLRNRLHLPPLSERRTD